MAHQDAAALYQLPLNVQIQKLEFCYCFIQMKYTIERNASVLSAFPLSTQGILSSPKTSQSWQTRTFSRRRGDGCLPGKEGKVLFTQQQLGSPPSFPEPSMPPPLNIPGEEESSRLVNFIMVFFLLALKQSLAVLPRLGGSDLPAASSLAEEHKNHNTWLYSIFFLKNSNNKL